MRTMKRRFKMAIMLILRINPRLTGYVREEE